MKTHKMSRLVKSEDLNHHGTLFAGRMAEWFVEGTFVAAASLYGNPNNIVCVKVHGMKFTKPVQKGDIIELLTKAVVVGKTSITVYGKVVKDGEDDAIVEGFTTFVCVDEEGHKMEHGLKPIVPKTEEEQRLIEIGEKLR